MKRVLAACIDQLLEFDSETSFNEYIKNLESKKQWYKVLYVNRHQCGMVAVRVRKQYNRHIWEQEGD